MNARPKFYLDIEDAAFVMYPKGWRKPPTDEIDRQRATEAREDQRRDDDYREGDSE